MSSNSRTTSRGGKGAKGDKAHKLDKTDTGKAASDKQSLGTGGGGDTSKSNELKIRQVIEMTEKPEDQVCLALHECDYDMEKAIDMLLETKVEWETTVKKKKNRQQSTSKSEQKAEGTSPTGGVGDEWSENPPATTNTNEKEKPRNKSSGPQRIHGRHNDSRGWRGREKQENERNLEEGGGSGSGGSNRERRGRSSASIRGGSGRGRGGGRAGGRYPQRSNRGGQFNTSRPMETWQNSWETTPATNHNAAEECWDEFPGADEWVGTLAETKVFTPSQPPEPITEQEPTPGITAIENSASLSSSVQQSMDILAQMQAAQNAPVPISGPLNAAQSQYFSQLTQQNSSSDISKYGVQQQQTGSYGGTPQFNSGQQNVYNNTVYSSNYVVQDSMSMPVQQPPVRTKTQRARVPPPSKIPASAVEMPGDLNNSMSYLDLQFGAMDIDSNSFDGVMDQKYPNASSLDNTSTSNNLDLNVQAQNVTSIDAYSPPKPSAQSSISSALSQSLSNTDSIPQTTEHISSGFNTVTVSGQRTVSTNVNSSTQSNTNSTALEQLSKQPESLAYPQVSNYNSYQPKSTYQNQTYNSSSSYSGTQTTYVANQQNSSYVNSDATSYNPQSVNSSYQNAYSTNNSYQTSASTTAFPTISQSNSYPSNNQAYQQNTSQSAYGTNSGLNNSNYNSNVAAQYSSTYNSNHKLVKESNSGYDNSSIVVSSVSSTSTPTTTGLSLTQTTASAAKANTSIAKNNGGNVVSNLPPSAPVMSTQYIMGQVPYFQPQIYSYEEMQMMQQRIPHMTTPFYEMSYQTPTTTLRDGSYSLSDGRFTRTDSNASPVPSTQTSTQPMIAGTTGPYFFTPYSPMQPSYQFGAVYTSQLPAGTNAHGSSNSAQYPKPGTYGSGYTSGYDPLSQSQDYNKGGYVSNTQGQSKGAGGNASSVGNAANDISAMYGKTHTALGKVNSYEKQGFHSGTPPPFTGALGQNALAPSGTGYGPQMYIPTIPHQQHHSTPMMHQPLHQDTGNSAGQRVQANNQPKAGAKQGYPSNNYWNQS